MALCTERRKVLRDGWLKYADNVLGMGWNVLHDDSFSHSYEKAIIN